MKRRNRAALGRRLTGTLFALAAMFAASTALAAKRKLALSDLTADPPIAGRSIAGVAWVPGGARFSYIARKGSGEESAAEIWISDVATGEKRLAASTEALTLPAEPPAGEIAPGVEKEPSKPRRIPPEGYRWSPDGERLLLSGEDDLWLLSPGARPERLARTEGGKAFPSFSPDGKRLAFVRKNDLYVIELASKRESRLTNDGSDRVWNGRLDWVYEEELASRNGRAYEWSPDGRAIAYLRLDDSPVDPYPIEDFLPVPARIRWQFYPKSGAKNPIASFHVVSADGKRLADVQVAPDEYILPSFSWTPDSAAVCYRVVNRAQTRLEARLVTPSDGRSRTLFVEEDPFWINDDGTDPPRFLSGGRFLWKSERRNGFAHLYVGNVSGGELRPITQGSWMVDQVCGVDEKGGWVYFTATEENVRRRPIYRVRLDGTGFARLTRGRGTHSAQLSDDGKYLLDTASSSGEPPSLSLSESAGKLVRVVEKREGRLDEFDLGQTEEHEVAADDGTRLEARLVKPADFDPSRKYPVIVYVYGGPHAQVVRDVWTASSLFDSYLASRGFLVWSLDNRGSWGRGHQWESAIFRETGKRELADQLAGVRYLKSLPFVDSNRIGIWGWSYGGYMTLYSLTNAPDMWKCGVAGAPVTHWKFYDSIYTERYMRTPQENPKGYQASAPLSRAKDLKAKLLIIHGTADDNVHMQNTVAFVDALTKAGRPYELQIQPGQKHGFRGKASVDFRNAAIARFFEENL